MSKHVYSEIEPSVSKTSYEPPRVVHKGKLKQFAGSPLGDEDGANPLALPGQDQ